MIDIIEYFEKNKKNILDFILENRYIYPNMFIENVEIMHDENFYEKTRENPIFGYLFNIENIKIFNIERINDIYAFKSDKKYKCICLSFFSFLEIFLNNRSIKNQTFISYDSQDEILIKGDFLKISYVEKEIFDFDDFLISYYEKNLFDDFKIKKYLFRNLNVLKVF